MWNWWAVRLTVRGISPLLALKISGGHERIAPTLFPAISDPECGGGGLRIGIDVGGIVRVPVAIGDDQPASPS